MCMHAENPKRIRFGFFSSFAQRYKQKKNTVNDLLRLETLKQTYCMLMDENTRNCIATKYNIQFGFSAFLQLNNKSQLLLPLRAILKIRGK